MHIAMNNLTEKEGREYYNENVGCIHNIYAYGGLRYAKASYSYVKCHRGPLP